MCWLDQHYLLMLQATESHMVLVGSRRTKSNKCTCAIAAVHLMPRKSEHDIIIIT